MYNRRRGCHEPEVQKCLHCEKPDCDCADDAKPHVSELYALLCAGMIRPQSITRHYQQKGRAFRKDVNKHAGNRLHDPAARTDST